MAMVSTKLVFVLHMFGLGVCTLDLLTGTSVVRPVEEVAQKNEKISKSIRHQILIQSNPPYEYWSA